MTQDTQPRRRFLQQAVALVPATTLAGGMVVSQTACSSDTAPRQAQAKPYQPTYFNAEEWAFINAAVDHLIPADDLGPGAVAAGVPEFIDRQMEDPYGHGKLWYMQGPFNTEQPPEMGYQLEQTPRDIYRNGIASLNAWSRDKHGKVYAELEAGVQAQILHDLQGNKIKLDKVPATTFFSTLLGNTKEGFFADPMYGGNKHMVGWKLVGFPGARGDFMDWTDQPNVKYPYGPVSISGEKG
ncbi:gluconate 2-dehydrogenase subunit 3 family protein [Pseudomonadota bacterium AL_CKDN230030165-1A_HGKHYDSX7]